MFILNECPVVSATLNCDTHCNKIILEVAQMLCTTYRLQDIEAPYKMCHVNHPVTKWIRQSRDNFNWACEHALALYDEKVYRTEKGHKSIDVISWAIQKQNQLSFEQDNLTPFAIAISQDSLCRGQSDFNESDPVKCYQLYYKFDKSEIAKWTKRDIPSFMY